MGFFKSNNNEKEIKRLSDKLDKINARVVTIEQYIQSKQSKDEDKDKPNNEEESEPKSIKTDVDSKRGYIKDPVPYVTCNGIPGVGQKAYLAIRSLEDNSLLEIKTFDSKVAAGRFVNKSQAWYASTKDYYATKGERDKMITVYRDKHGNLYTHGKMRSLDSRKDTPKNLIYKHTVYIYDDQGKLRSKRRFKDMKEASDFLNHGSSYYRNRKRDEIEKGIWKGYLEVFKDESGYYHVYRPNDDSKDNDDTNKFKIEE